MNKIFEVLRIGLIVLSLPYRERGGERREEEGRAIYIERRRREEE